MDALEKQVQMWSPASHGMWAIWGVVQARDTLEAEADDGAEAEFDYLGYAQGRFKGFQRGLKALDLSV